MFHTYIRGRHRRFATWEDAQAYANRQHARYGVFVGLEACKH